MATIIRRNLNLYLDIIFPNRSLMLEFEDSTPKSVYPKARKSIYGCLL